jgi:hypothetical protein
MKKLVIFCCCFFLFLSSIYSQQLVPYLLKNGRYSYVEYGKSKILMNAQYDDAKPFFEDYACVKLKNKWGVINLKGEIVVPIEHDRISNTKYGYTRVDKDYYNRNFEKMLFKFVVGFSDGYAIINERGNLYIIDTFLNKTILPIKESGVGYYYDEKNNPITFFKFSGGFFRIEYYDSSGEGYNYINLRGKILLKNNYDFAEDFVNGLAKVGFGDHSKKYGYIDTIGNEVIPLRYDKLGDFSEGLATAEIGTGFGYINKKGEVTIPLQSNYKAGDFQFGLARALDKNGSKMFYIDKKGIIDMNIQYGQYEDFYDGLALFDKLGSCGFIDLKGNVVIPPKYNYATHFDNGYALVSKEIDHTHYLIGIINKKGVEVIPCKYEKIYIEFQDDESNKYIFERSCDSNVISSHNLDNLIYPFIVNNTFRVVLFGQQYYVDVNGYEYFEK